MKENKRYIATPITEETKSKILDDERYFVYYNNDAGYYDYGVVIKDHWDSVEVLLIEQPLTSSVTAEEIMKKLIPNGCINLKSFEEEKRLICKVAEEYATQLQTTSPSFQTRYIPTEDEKILLNRILKRGEPSFPSDEEIEKELVIEILARFTGNSRGIPIAKQAFIDGANHMIKWLSSYKEQTKNKGGWISVEDRPLYTKDEKGNWTCTEDGDNDFIAAVPYSDTTKPDEHLWWIRHCVVEDSTGLCIVCDDYNEPAGWDLEAVTHWMPLPEPPKEETNK